MVAAFVLYVVLYAGPNNQRPVSITGEHTSKQACEDAKRLIRENLNNGSVLLAVCTPK